MKSISFALVLLLALASTTSPQPQPSYSITAQQVLDDIKRVGVVWFSRKDKAFSDHLTSLTVELGKHPRMQASTRRSPLNQLTRSGKRGSQCWLSTPTMRATLDPSMRPRKKMGNDGCPSTLRR